MKQAFLLVLAVLFFSCDEKKSVEKEIEKISINIKITRFDQVFAAATLENLDGLKAKYPVFFPQQFNDSIWVQKMQDTLQMQLEQEVEIAFPTNEILEDKLLPLFQHIKYYFPQFEAPHVYTATSDVDYQNRVIVADSIMVIALDTYLGSNHPFYEGIQKYIVQDLKLSNLAPDVAEQFSRKYISRPTDRLFLSQLIYFGKQLYLKDLWLPSTGDAEKIGYTEAQLQWAIANETEIWRYFVEKEILYSTDSKLVSRFVAPAPFSKFYLELDNESPGMVGRYIGWQIVKAYMENNDVSVSQLMTAEADKIFKKSKYKPKK